jgi:hypothetical protein
MRLYADRNRLTNKLFKLKMQKAKILIIIQTSLTLEKKPNRNRYLLYQLMRTNNLKSQSAKWSAYSIANAIELIGTRLTFNTDNLS